MKASAKHWRSDPRLLGKFHPDHPDDLQVIVHDGGPRVTERRPEAVWVGVTAASDDVYTGRVLNAPRQLASVRAHQTVQFVVAQGAAHPVMVTEKYLGERTAWRIQACSGCGLDVLFDAPSDLIRIIFPSIPADATLDAFTSFCPLCDGVQGVASIAAPAPAKRARAWWDVFSRQ